MPSHLWTSACAFALLFAVQSTASLAQQPKIGSAANTKNSVQGIVEGNTQTLSNGSELYANETVRTGAASVTDLQFIDESKMSVGPISEVHLDKFVYDPSGSSGTVVINATKGAFRFVTGSQDKKAYQIKTPYGTLGIRG